MGYQTIHFTKMHGAGNDYIYVDTTRYPIALVRPPSGGVPTIQA